MFLIGRKSRGQGGDENSFLGNLTELEDVSSQEVARLTKIHSWLPGHKNQLSNSSGGPLYIPKFEVEFEAMTFMLISNMYNFIGLSFIFLKLWPFED